MARWLNIILCGCCLLWGSGVQAALLRAETSVALPHIPAAVVARDMNWNNVPDLVIANPATNTVSVLTNSGVPTFGTIYEYAVGTGPRALVLADFSGDGYIDVAVANQNGNSISILNNRAVSGVEFNAAVSYAAGTGPVAIVAGLFNNDLFNDLVVVNPPTNSISVLFNSGSGIFPTTISYGVGSLPVAVAAADFDGNGALDLVVANQGNNTISLLMNDGNGGFAAPVSYGAGDSPSAIALLDVDHNGTIDIAVTNATAATVSWLSNSGNGVFQFVASYSVGTTPTALVAVDMNGDGYDDLAVANEGSNTVSLLENNRDSSFAAAVTAAVGITPVSIAAADLDFDGDNDLMTVNSGSTTLSLVMNDTDFHPDQFTFVDQVDVPLSSWVESNVVTLTGMTGWRRIAVSGGEYSISTDSGVTWSPWSSASSAVITAGHQLKLRLVSSAQGHVNTTVLVNIDSVHDIFTVKTIGDVAPDPFSFIDQSGVALNMSITSNIITITGIDVDSTIYVIGGVYRINGGLYTTAVGTVSNNDTIELLLTSSALSGGVVDMLVSIGDITDTFTVTTRTKSESGAGGGGALEVAWLILLGLLCCRRCTP